jgi:hypothetical protein
MVKYPELSSSSSWKCLAMNSINCGSWTHMLVIGCCCCCNVVWL